MIAALRPAFAAGAAAAVLAAALIGAWIIQYGFGYEPCALCLTQRWPYYVAIPLGAAVALASARGASRTMVIAGLAVLALVLAWSTVLGVHHAGVEWRWWAGPTDCVALPQPSIGAGGLMDQMRQTRITPCDEAALRIAGLSLAGWNALISAGLLALVGAALVRALRR